MSEFKPKPPWSRIGQEAGPPLEAVPEKEIKKSPEERAEELWALWQDYLRLYLEIGRAKRKKQEPLPATSARFESVKKALAERWHDPKVQELYKKNLERSIAERERLAPSYKNYQHEERLYETASSRRDELYQEIYKHREKEPDELTLLELAELSANIKTAKVQMEQMEKADPELAARLSFERLAEYRRQMQKEGFIWTPSREHFFRELLERTTLLNRNRPLVLVGETGTGKTEMVRALSKRLTGSEPARTTARDQSDPGRTLGFRSLEGVAFGTLGQALTGKHSTQETKSGSGKISLIDEANKYPEDFIRMLVKTLAGRKPGDEITFDEWYGADQILAPEALIVLSMNLPDPERGRHLDRPDFSPEVKRELAPTVTRMEYMPQSAENPELFEMILAASMDRAGHIRLPKEWLAPDYKEVVNPAIKVKTFELDPDPKAGGALWRFANLIAQSQRLYEGTAETISPTSAEAARLEHAVLDVGVAIGWIGEYKKSAFRQGITLQKFLAQRIESWVGGKERGQYLFPPEDREVFHKLLAEYRLNHEAAEDKQPFPQGRADLAVIHPAILSPQEIGALSPRVPRVPEYLKAAPPPVEAKIYLEDDTEIIYRPEALGDIQPGSRFVQKADKAKKPWTFKGVTKEGKAVLEAPDGIGNLIQPAEFAKQFERAEIRGEALCREMRERFGQGFLGLEEVEAAFTLKDGSKLIDLTPAEREQALRLLEKKLKEPDIQEFLSRTPKETLQRDWLFILRVPQLKDKTPLTMKALEERLAPDLLAQNQGKLFYDIDWCKNESFYTTESIKDLHWQLVSRAVLSKTKGKDHTAQTALLQEEAQDLGLDSTKTRRRIPVEIPYDFLVVLRATRQRILENEYDWTDIRASDGDLVRVGRCDAGGAGVNGWYLEHARENMGASLSR